MEMEELIKLLIAILVLLLLIGIAVFFLKGKGGEIISSIKNFMRLGR